MKQTYKRKIYIYIYITTISQTLKIMVFTMFKKVKDKNDNLSRKSGKFQKYIEILDLKNLITKSRIKSVF